MSKPSGFNNTGVICWFNSLLQSLISCHKFVEYFKGQKIKEENSCIHNELINLIIKIEENEDIKNMSSILLNALVKDLQNKNKKIDLGFGQQASDEGFIFLLDIINKKKLEKIFEHVYEEVIICKETDKVVSRKRSYNNIFNVFDEENLIKNGLNEYILQNEESDLKDYGKENTYRRLYILRRISPIIIIALNRFNTDGKNFKPRNAKIKLPDYLEFPHINGTIMKYKKISEIDHTGSLSGGHYVSRCLRNDNVYLFNDINVSNCHLETLQSTFLTFYESVL